MSQLSNLLRDADPLSHEPLRTEAERRASRAAIVHAAPAAPPPSRRFVVSVSVAALALVSVAFMSGLWSRGLIAAVRFEVRLAEEAPAAGLVEASVSGGDRKVYLHPEVVLSNGDIAHAEVVDAGPASFNVSLTFTPEGSAKMRRATASHIGRPLAILVDGEVVLAPVVRDAITGPQGMITGNYTRAEAERVASGVVGR
jgi:hypothetical protein